MQKVIVPGQTYKVYTSHGVQLSKTDKKAGKPAYVTEVTEVVAQEPIPLPAGNQELWRVVDAEGNVSKLWANQLQ